MALFLSEVFVREDLSSLGAWSRHESKNTVSCSDAERSVVHKTRQVPSMPEERGGEGGLCIHKHTLTKFKC